MTVQIANTEMSEAGTTSEAIEPIEEGVAAEKIIRKWNHGSTQTSDDMYLGGLMCE